MLFWRLWIFQYQLFLQIISGIQSEWQTVWIQIRPNILVEPDLGPNCLQRLSEQRTLEGKAYCFGTQSLKLSDSFGLMDNMRRSRKFC